MTGAWDSLKRLLVPAVDLAESESVSLVVETGNNAMLASGHLAGRPVEEIGSARLHVLWDPGNSLDCAEPAYPDGYEAVRDCLAHVHVKDLRVDIPRATVRQCRFGDGQMSA